MSGKAPSFQFYPGDWLKDPQLSMASATSRGIWIDFISASFWAPVRGVLEATSAQFARLLRCSTSEFITFVHEARSLGFANVTGDVRAMSAPDIDGNEPQSQVDMSARVRPMSHEMSSESPGLIRIECRRMMRDEKQRQAWANQKSKQRSRSSNGSCPSDVRLVSSESPAAPSSSASAFKTNGATAPGIDPSGSRKSRTPKNENSPEFEKAFSLYPPTPRGHSKPAAYKAWCARINDGVSPEELIAGVERYAAYVRASGTIVKNASTFFGPDEHWKLPWAFAGSRSNGKKPEQPPPTGEEYWSAQQK